MPIYVYRCPACGREQEIIRTIAERDVLPACHGDLMERVATSGLFQVNGFSAKNNYSTLDTGWQKRRDGIRTRVHGGHVDID
jgi:putative FmdB family regulatory protein